MAASKMNKAVSELRQTFRAGKTLPLQVRKAQLKRLSCMLCERSDDICDALYKDLKKPKIEAFCYEVQIVLNDIEFALKNLKNWSSPRKVSRNLMQALDSAYVFAQPLGVVLIISTWNYPVHLLLMPLVGAIAAGNCVILKPSELAQNTAQLMSSIINNYLSKDIVRVILGGPEESALLLKERFDHIFFTGSNKVGKLIMKAAVENLTPVTLELGGKCPVIVDSNAKLEVAAKRIVWGKLTNCGQTCIAPDYVMCHKAVKSEFVNYLDHFIRHFYGKDPQQSADYSRILNRDNTERLCRLISKSHVLLGGKSVVEDCYVEPTVVEATMSDEIMKEEIFGPILPIVTVDDVNEALEFLSEGAKPLGVYLFSSDCKVQQKVLQTSYSGAVVINDVVVHLALQTLPFGGVGSSGMGRYHGKYTFDTFSHDKAVIKRPEYGEGVLWMRYPPFTESKFYWAKLIVKRRPLTTLALTTTIGLAFVMILLILPFAWL